MIWTALTLWWLGMVSFVFRNRRAFRFAAHALFIAGWLMAVFFLARHWVELQRPPFKTLGETRLMYGVLLPIVGYAVFLRRRIEWLTGYCVLIAFTFMLINAIRPEAMDKQLPAALQSVWFVPHVIVYMVAYALLTGATIAGVKGAYLSIKGGPVWEAVATADRLVLTGFPFLTLGLLFGALWAKVAWGDYWTWDPKETWAFLTWIVYLVYLHLRMAHRNMERLALWFLCAAFAMLMLCWFGVNYMPSAAGSVHTY